MNAYVFLLISSNGSLTSSVTALIEESINKLKRSDIASYKIDSEILMSKAINKNRTYVILNPEEKIDNKRKKIFDLLPNKLTNLKSVGRLDFMSEGLILLTNNGDYSRFLELPPNSHQAGRV